MARPTTAAACRPSFARSDRRRHGSGDPAPARAGTGACGAESRRRGSMRSTQFMRDNDPDGYVEVQGIAEGFGIAADALFACLYGNVIADLAGDPALADACTAWAVAARTGPVRSSSRIATPAARSRRLRAMSAMPTPSGATRRILCVGHARRAGSITRAGSTRTAWRSPTRTSGTADHGEGWLRPFLMTRLLRECATVGRSGRARLPRCRTQAAGTLLIGDATGAVAAIELAHGATAPRSRASATTSRARTISPAIGCAAATLPAPTTSARAVARAPRDARACAARIAGAVRARGDRTAHGPPWGQRERRPLPPR